MKEMTHSKLIALIAGMSGSVIVGLLALTDAKARKTGNPYGAIFKQVRAVGFVGSNYENAVNREAARQGIKADFVADALVWGVWMIPNKIIEHKGEFYLRTQSTPNQRRKQPAKVLCYRNETGQFLSYDSIKQFLPEKKESAKQQDEGLDETVWIRTYKLSNIQRIRIGGETYKLIK